jgi:hypothetical protein
MSFNYGAKEYGRVKQTIRYTAVILLVYTLFAWGMTMLFPNQFLRTFHGFHPYAQGSASLCSLFRDLSNDTAEFTLCYGLHNCSPLLPRLLYPLA